MTTKARDGIPSPEEVAELYVTVRTFFRVKAGAADDRVDDLTQETMLAAWSRRENPPDGKVDNWRHYVLGIARHKWCDELAARGRRRDRSVPLEELPDGRLRELVQAARAEAVLQERDLRARIRAALRRLADDERRILELRYVDELRNRDAAARLGIAPEAASRLKYRALEKLRGSLEGNDPDGPRGPRR